MPEKMNIYQKLQKCRVELQKSDLKKSGRNTYSNYDYFELGDFLPKTNELFAAHNLIGIVSFEAENATLTIRDTEKPEDTIIFACPNAEVGLKGAHAIQNIGALQTYQRRYLWITAMELSEHDAVDRSEGNKESEDKMVELTFEDVSKQKIGFGKHKGKTLLDIFERHPDYVAWYLENGTDEKIKNSFEVIDRHMHAEMDFEKPIDATKIATIKGLLEKTDSSESDFLKFYKLERLEDMTIDTFARAMKALEKKLEKANYAGTPFEDLPI